jgi:hypothetical protein
MKGLAEIFLMETLKNTVFLRKLMLAPILMSIPVWFLKKFR